jgi:hypothetical protein
MRSRSASAKAATMVMNSLPWPLATSPPTSSRWIGRAAAEAAPARRQVELGDAPRRAAVPARERADEPPPQPAVGRPRRREPDAVVDRLAPTR